MVFGARRKFTQKTSGYLYPKIEFDLSEQRSQTNVKRDVRLAPHTVSFLQNGPLLSAYRTHNFSANHYS